MRSAARTVRYWGPLLLGFVCLIVSQYVSGIATYLLVVASLGLILDAATAMFARAGGTGNVTTYRQ
jgi:hypothetical protein